MRKVGGVQWRWKSVKPVEDELVMHEGGLGIDGENTRWMCRGVKAVEKVDEK